MIQDDHLSFNTLTNERVPTPAKYKAFINEITAVCEKHKLSISHEDGHGAFMIVPYEALYTEWLEDAQLEDNDLL